MITENDPARRILIYCAKLDDRMVFVGYDVELDKVNQAICYKNRGENRHRS